MTFDFEELYNFSMVMKGEGVTNLPSYNPHKTVSLCWHIRAQSGFVKVMKQQEKLQS